MQPKYNGLIRDLPIGYGLGRKITEQVNSQCLSQSITDLSEVCQLALTKQVNSQ